MKKEGYEVAERILSPDQFGVPQHRKRIYIVGVKIIVYIDEVTYSFEF